MQQHQPNDLEIVNVRNPTQQTRLLGGHILQVLRHKVIMTQWSAQYLDALEVAGHQRTPPDHRIWVRDSGDAGQVELNRHGTDQIPERSTHPQAHGFDVAGDLSVVRLRTEALDGRLHRPAMPAFHTELPPSLSCHSNALSCRS